MIILALTKTLHLTRFMTQMLNNKLYMMRVLFL